MQECGRSIKNGGDHNRSPIADLCRFLWCSREINSTVWGWFDLKFKLTKALMVVRVTCKNEEDPIKNEGARVVNAQGQLTP